MIVSILILIPFALLAAVLTVPGWAKRHRAASPPAPEPSRPAPRPRRQPARATRRITPPPSMPAAEPYRYDNGVAIGATPEKEP